MKNKTIFIIFVIMILLSVSVLSDTIYNVTKSSYDNAQYASAYGTNGYWATFKITTANPSYSSYKINNITTSLARAYGSWSTGSILRYDIYLTNSSHQATGSKIGDCNVTGFTPSTLIPSTSYTSPSLVNVVCGNQPQILNNTEYGIFFYANGDNTHLAVAEQNGAVDYAGTCTSGPNACTIFTGAGRQMPTVIIYGGINGTVVTNYTITAQQTNGTALTTFNATIQNGTSTYNYGTTNGSIITDKLSNSTTLYNTTVNATGYIPRTYTNENASVNLLANLTRNAIGIVFNYPSNNYHTNERPVNLTYNITTNITTTCDININGIKNTTQTTSSNNKLGYYVNLSDGNYNWTINCTDGLNTNTTSSQNFTIDATSPTWTIRSISTSNTTAIDRENQNWIYINDTISDTNLFAYNLTVKYPNGSVWFSNSTFNTTLSQINITRNQTITSSEPNGTYTINYYAEDDHTAKTIGNYTNAIDITNRRITYITTNDTQIFVQVIAWSTVPKTFSTNKEIDRYTWDFNFTSGSKPYKFTFFVNSTKPMYYRPQYSFPSFVTGDNWIDFNLANDNSTSYITTPYLNGYKINITTNSSDLHFSSLGGLNIVNETYTFNIFVYSAPNITGTSPANNFSMADGSNVTFKTNATDPANLSLTYKYYYDGTLVYTGQNYTFTAPFSSHGIHNMTVNVTNSANKQTSYTWNFTITHSNAGPIVTNMSYTPLLSWFANIGNTYITCSGYDQDNETNQTSLTYTIEYNTGGIFWTTLTPEYVSGNTWRAYVNITTLTGQTLDARCKISDGEDETSYTYLNDFQTIAEAYYQLGNVTKITPYSGNRDFVTPVTCAIDSFGTTPSYRIVYNIKAQINGVWETIGIGTSDKALFDMARINYGENVNFSCQAYDGYTWTNTYTSQPITRQHQTKLMMYSKGGDEVLYSNKIYGKGLLADFYNQPNISIISAFADCNGDGYYDYYWNYNTTINYTQEMFTCYNAKGVITHTVGVFINKTGRNDLFCGQTTSGVCKLERSYGVIIK